MGQGYFLDSNVIIGYLAGRISSSGMEIVSEIVSNRPNISVISQIEVLRFNNTPENEAVLEEFINMSKVYPLSSNVVERTIKLCKQIKIKLPDAIIAAIALLDFQAPIQSTSARGQRLTRHPHRSHLRLARRSRRAAALL